MGRKARKAEKRREIVQAFMDCVVEIGLERASMAEVAARMGLDRSTIHYYFRTREMLIAEAAKAIANTYVSHLESAVAGFAPQRRPRQMIEFLLGPTFHQPKLSLLIDELSVAGNRDVFVEKQVAGIYRALERMIAAEIHRDLPEAPLKSRQKVVWTIAQLVEGCSVFSSLGFPANRRRAALKAAVELLEALAQNK